MSFSGHTPFVDPEGMTGVLEPLKNHKNMGFLRNTGPDLLPKNQPDQPGIRCWAIIGPPAKYHFRFAGGPRMTHFKCYLDPPSSQH